MKKTILGIIILILILTGCQSEGNKTPAVTLSAEQVQLWAQQTIQVMVSSNTTKTAVVLIPQASPTATPTVIRPTIAIPTIVISQPTARPVIPTISYVQPVQKVCDQMGFVADVTVPDNTIMQPNQVFQKVWRIQNTGTCTWTTSYQFVFDSGYQLGAPSAINLPRNVLPNETIDISVDMQAPSVNGTYQGFWKMRNPSGIKFGTAATQSGNDSVWVKIIVNQGEDSGFVPTSYPGYIGNGTCSIISMFPTSADSFYAGQETDFTVTVRNESDTVWTASDFDIAFIGGTNMLKRPDGIRFDLKSDVYPGQTLTFGLDIITPSGYGTYTMEWGVVRNNEILCPIYFTANVNK